MHVHVHVHVGGIGGAVVVDYFHKYHDFVMNRREGGYMHLCQWRWKAYVTCRCTHDDKIATTPSNIEKEELFGFCFVDRRVL